MRLALACSLAVAACQAPVDDEAAAPAAPPAVRVVAAQRGAIAARLPATGETAALRSVRLSSPVTGRVTALAAHPGDRIAANAVAARVLPIENEAAVQGLGVMRDGDALDPHERPMAERLARDLAGRDLAVRAPFAGIVADRLHNPGEQVAANDVLLEVFDPLSMVVIAQVPLQASGSIRPGQTVEVQAGGARGSGTVATLLPAVTPQSLTVSVRIALTTPLPPLLHAAVECHIVTAEHPDALLIPRTALRSTEGEEHGSVVVVSGDQASYRRVRLGLRDAEHIEIVEGLEPGELVVADGGFTLPDGTRVAPQVDGAS